ncbi:MAG: NnrS family protein [Alphaproteobacteria bacterium]|nr:NnrS family protein [Alphaproteobacteria bacterium]
MSACTMRPAARGLGRFALFECGFRPFFLLVGLHGALVIPVWVAVVFGWLRLPVGMEVSWHAHQMVYGFAAAGLAEFLLTAVPSWTGAPARRGAPLIALAALWLAARIATTVPDLVSPAIAALLDLAFISALAALIVGPLLAAGKARNLMLLVPLALFWIGDLLMHAEFLDVTEDTAAIGARLGIDVMLLMITVIGGRIIPTFTANALRVSGVAVEPQSSAWLDSGSIAAMALLLVSEAVTGMSAGTGIAALLAAVFNGARLAGWRGERTLRSPILWVLHLGYTWLVLGLFLKAIAVLTDTIPETAALHALTAGAMGTMLLAVMSRAGLGHTGRALKAHPATVGSYLLISIAAGIARHRGNGAAAPFRASDRLGTRMGGRVPAFSCGLRPDPDDRAPRRPSGLRAHASLA